MTGVTLLIAITGVLLVLFLGRVPAMAAFLAVLFWYPNFLVVSLGTIDISVGRIVGSALLMRCLCNKRISSHFHWCRLDTMVTSYVAVTVLIYVLTQPFAQVMENRSGFIMDTWFAYLVSRFIIQDKKDFLQLIKLVCFIILPLAILGVYEAVTGHLPYFQLRRFCPWMTRIKPQEGRWGFDRAMGPFNHPILFGCVFSMFMPYIYYLRNQKNSWRYLSYIFLAGAALGSMSSMSSGPWIMTIVVLFCFLLEPVRKYIKYLLLVIVLGCIFIAIISNRPFYYVIVSYCNPIGGAGYHRARLIEISMRFFHEWCLLGYKGQDPGWGIYMGMTHTDVTNMFLLQGVRYGFGGMLAFCGIFYFAYAGIWKVQKRLRSKEDDLFFWAIKCMMFATIITMMSVGYFGQTLTLFFALTGMIGSVHALGRAPISCRQLKKRVVNQDEVNRRPQIARKPD